MAHERQTNEINRNIKSVYMKQFFLIFFAITLTTSVFTQDTVKLYLDGNFNRAEKNNASYERTAIIANGHYYLTDKNMEGQMVNYVEFKSINPNYDFRA